MTSKNWKDRLESRIKELAGGAGPASDLAITNAEMVERALKGMGPDRDEALAGLGARLVMNMSAVNIPAFCDPPKGEKAYKNAYDLEKYPRLGLSGGKVQPRELVDSVLYNLMGIKPDDIYFGAIELNGSGIRFYGDLCLVLRRDKVPEDTPVLFSNSYDLLRPPITPVGTKPAKGDLQKPASDMEGSWGESMPAMAALKTFAVRLVTSRRITTGQISEGVLEDEDYLEVLKKNSFSRLDLQEVRLSATEVAAEDHIAERQRLGPCPSLAELQWRKHRRSALNALDEAGIQTRVVTTLGRVR
jgi:hypothetical protein